MEPYSILEAVLSDRIRWSTATMAALVTEGRGAGWIAGDASATTANPGALRSLITERASDAQLSVTIDPLRWLAARVGLTLQELDALWILVCCELDPATARLAQTFGDGTTTDLSILHWRRLIQLGTGTSLDSTSLERLADLVLIETEFDPRVPLHRRSVRANDRVIELARGELRIDREIERIVTIVPTSHEGEAPSVPALITRALGTRPSPLVVAVGAIGSGRATTMRAATERGVIDVALEEFATEPSTASRQLRVVAREALLFGVTPVLRNLPDQTGALALAIDRVFLRSYSGVVLATAATSPDWIKARTVVTYEMPKLASASAEAIWRAALPGADPLVIDQASRRYAITPQAILVAAANAAATVGGESSAIEMSHVHDGLRAHLSKQLGQLANRIEWKQTWDDLVLPADQFDQIVELVARVRHRRKVLETWGFGAKVGKGFGISALLSGPPGTGKTMVAGLIANELGLDLYQVDLSRIVSKYIGETEKNLALLFDAAESGHGILLFDEADSLFAKRSEVKSSNDRYANLEVNYLLQRMEQFTGISLLTTNHETAIDEAFRRRLALHVRFPMPDAAQRSALWKAMIPGEADVEDNLDFERLGCEFAMSGGYVKNAVVRAAYLAADGGGSIGMSHLLRAAHAEYEALGKVTLRAAA